MRDRLRVGVIGLGRLWEARHKPSLLRMRDRFQVAAVYDQVRRRAEIEAASLRCAAPEGIAELVGRPDVDAVYLIAPQWFGTYPIEVACELRKPVYCALSLGSHPGELDRLAAKVAEGGIAFMPELARRFYPATRRLLELLGGPLGAPRLVLGQSRLFGFDRYAPPGPTTQVAPAPLRVDPGGNLLDWCRLVFGAEPVALQGFRAEVIAGADLGGAGPDFESFVADFPGGASAQMSIARHHADRWGDATRFLPPAGIQVFAERGAAWLEMPDRIQWSDAEGLHEERLPVEPPLGDVLNDQFHRLVRGEASQAPGFADALAVARGVLALRESQSEGRKLAPPGKV